MTEKKPQEEQPLHEVLFTGQHLLLLRASQAGEGAACLLKTPVNDAVVPSALAQLEHEYEICRNLDVAGIVRPVSKETLEGRPAVAFEDPGGATLAQLLAKGSVELPVFFDIVVQLAGIVGRLHRKGIVHKDIHAGNILVCADQEPVQVYLTGLGIAALLPRESIEQTAPDKLEGTLATMSPEQTGRMARPVDSRTDFYSLGAVFYQMLTGRLPFESDDPLELVHAHLAKAPQPPSEIDPQIPSMVSDLVLKLLAKEADERYRSAAGLVADLEQCRDEYARTGNVAAFALGQHDVSERFHLPDKLYGREEEIRTLQAAFERASTGPVELVLVTGSAGIGKTELVNQLRRLVVQQDGVFVTGKCDPLARNIPCAPFIQAISDGVDQALKQPQETLDRLRHDLGHALGDQGRVLTDIIPMLSLIIGEPPPVPELPPEQARNRFHLMLQRLFAAATMRGRPVVVFLDDLHWADFSTLKLLEILASDPDLCHVLLIGAYREREIDEAHGLPRIVKKIEESGGRVHTLVLGPLNAEALNALITDALHAPPDTTGELATLCLRKTGGNPFFLKRFLLELVSRRLIVFETTRNTWQWHADRIGHADVTDNVVELMTRTIVTFEKKVRKLLELAACVGGSFDLGILCAVTEQSPRTILTDLWPAVEAGLVIMLPGTHLRVVPAPDGHATAPVIDADEALDTIRFRFIHDRVYEAAYGLMNAEHKMGTHLRLGRLMLDNCDTQELPDKIFDIVSHLNRAAALITTPDEIKVLAELNLEAGQRARFLALFESAFDYFRLGIELMTAKDWHAKGWQDQYELTKELHLKGIEAAYLSGQYGEMERWYAAAVEHIRNPLEAVDAYIIKIQKTSTEQNHLDAVNTGLAMLTRLGFSLPTNPTEADVKAELQETSKLLSSFSIEEIVNLPEMEDPYHLAICKIIVNLIDSAFFVNRPLYHMMICKNLHLMLCHGNGKHSAQLLCSYAYVLSTFEGKPDKAATYGRLGVRFLEYYKDPKYENRVKYVFLCNILPVSEHVEKTVKPLWAVHNACMEIGDIIYAGASLFVAELARFFIGEKLERVDSHMHESRKILMSIRHKTMVILTDMYHQVVLNLMGRSDSTSDLIGDRFDERIYLSSMLEAKNQTFLVGIYCCKLMLAYLFEQFQDAVGLAEKIYTSPYLPHMPWYQSRSYCYGALARLVLCATNSAHQYEAILEKVAYNQERLQLLTEAAPMNYRHQLCLVNAERARVEGRIFEAQEHYDRAIELAQENGYLQDQALANELAAKFWMTRGKTPFACLYMDRAVDCYTRWGAAAKVRDLKEKHPEFFTEARGKAFAAEPGAPDLDVMSALRASRAISGEIVLNRLLEKLMTVVIENAGATHGQLLLDTDGTLSLAAEASADRPGQIVKPDHISDVEQLSSLLPVQIVHYVQRTGKSLVLDDAAAHERFARDPYILNNRPRSVLCSPIVRQEHLVGLLYLENNLTTSAFTADRLKMLEILSAQIAVSLENARLYEAQRLAEQEIRRLTEQLHSENVYLREEIKLEHNFDEIIGQSNPLKYLLFTIEQVAATETIVLITGESGTGKELVARAVHETGNRNDRPLVKVNCAALPSHLIESELFGHEKGAFTGAHTKRIGRFELADGATLFLDEIGELPLDLQPKLLRAIQEGEFERLGSSRTLKVDVRLIAATNRDLEAEVRAGRFREDLYYRLNVFPLSVPPLRERSDDIPLLVRAFVQRFSKKTGKQIETIPQRAMDALQQYAWPGNIRELENVIERSVITSPDKVLRVELPATSAPDMGTRKTPEERGLRGDELSETSAPPDDMESRTTLEEVERDHILRILKQTDWRISGERGAARILGLNPSTLRFRMRKLGIKRSRKHEEE